MATLETRQPTSNAKLWRIVGLAIAGYAFIFLLLLVQIFLVSFCVHYALSDEASWYERIVSVLVAIVLFVGVFHLFRAIFARSWAMEGYELPEDAPLFVAMREIAEQIGSPAPTRIFIDHDFNASAGVNKAFLPWRKDAFVTVGVPLAAALTPDELKAVLAHELGHHSRKHSRVSNWVYRVRWSWDGVDDAFDHLPDFVAHFVEKFYGWFIPVFQRESFEIARANEYEADAVAATVVGPGPLASSLTRLETIAPWLDGSYWPKLFRLVEKRSKPPPHVLSHLARTLKSFDGPALTRRFHAVDPKAAHEHDTHPSLAERVAALGQQLDAPAPIDESGLILLGSYQDEILDQLSQEWQDEHADEWASTHQRKRWVRDRMAQLQADRDPTTADLEELAALYLEEQHHAKAFACFRSIYRKRRHPRDLARCAETLAQIKGQREKAMDTARKALGAAPDVDLDLTRLLHALSDSPDERDRLAQDYERLEEIVEEREELFEEGKLGQEQLKKLLSPRLHENDLERITTHLAAITVIQEAHLIEVPSDDDYSWRQYFLFISIDDVPDDEDAEEELWDQISAECWVTYGNIQVIDAMDQLRAWANSRRVAGATLVHRKKGIPG